MAETRAVSAPRLSNDECARCRLTQAQGGLAAGEMVVLWYSPDDGEYFWQDHDGAGDLVSQGFPSRSHAIQALGTGKVKFDY